VTGDPDAGLPDADYVLLGSRVALGLDGGFAVAVPRRLRLLAEAGAIDPLLLSVDGAPPEVHAAQRQEFVDAGLLERTTSARNLFDDIVADPSWLWELGEPAEAPVAGLEYRAVTDAAGRALVSLPVLPNNPEWHLSDVPVVIHAPDGDRWLRGFRALYIAWLSRIADDRRAAEGTPSACSW
jgi:poly(glycerol-phosphate) alpha-glucosyltransferase